MKFEIESVKNGYLINAYVSGNGKAGKYIAENLREVEKIFRELLHTRYNKKW